MLNNLPGILLATVILVPLGILVFPVVYMAARIPVLVLPPICAIVTFRDAKVNGELGDRKKTYWTLFLAVVVPAAVPAIHENQPGRRSSWKNSRSAASNAGRQQPGGSAPLTGGAPCLIVVPVDRTERSSDVRQHE